MIIVQNPEPEFSDQVSSEMLLEAAHPNIYRANAFRITQLPVDASTRDIARQLDKIRMMEKYGGSSLKQRGPMPIFPPPDTDAIREAMQRLRDPERRLVDELFWFWPLLLGHSQQDPALLAMSANDLKKAAEIWLRKEKNNSTANIPLHNLAVLSHAAALDIEQAYETKKSSPGLDDKLDLYWRQSFERWGLLLYHDSFWHRLSDRIQEFGHPSLTADTSQRIRATLPVALLLVNAQLAVQAAGRNSSTVQRHLKLMNSSGFQEAAIAEALRRAVEPIRRHIKTLCDAATREVQSDPIHGDQSARRLAENSGKLLAILDSILPAESAVRNGAHDQIALTLLECQIKFSNKTENWATSLSLLETGKEMAASSSCKTRLEENIRLVQDSLKSNHNWCGPGYYALPAALLIKLEQYRDLADKEKWNDAIVNLQALSQDTTLSNKQRLLVTKALAYCLHNLVIKELNAALDLYNQEPAIWQDILARNEDPTPGFSNTLRAARQMSKGQEYYGALECLACGRQIQGSYFRWTYKEEPLIICPACNEKMDAEFNTDKEVLCKAITKAGQDLHRANDLDCTNNCITETFATVQKMAMRNNVNLPLLPDTSLRRLQSGMATLPDIISGLGSTRTEMKAAALQALADYENDATAATAPLIASFKSADEQYRREAFLTLNLINKDWHRAEAAARIASIITAWLDGNDIKMCEMAQLSLIKMGNAAVPDLTRILKNSKPTSRLNAAIILGRIGPAASGAIPALVRALQHSSPSPVIWDKIGKLISPSIGSSGEDEEEMQARIRSEILRACYMIDPNWLKSALAKKAVPFLQKMKLSPLPREREMASKLLSIIQNAAD